MKQSTSSLLTQQPFKTLWVIVAIILISIRMLFLSLYFLPKSLRPHPKWTYRQALSLEFIRSLFYHITLVRWTKALSLDPGAEKDRFVLVKPAKDIYHGILDNPKVHPAVIGGTWYPASFQPGDEQKTLILHFHGGSFLWSEGRDLDCGFAASTLLKHIPGKAFFIQYRLASDPTSPFPAAVQDAVTAYQYLLDKGIPASRIVISGDSAGGNIAIALLRYLSIEKSKAMPCPCALLLWSPSVDLCAQTNPYTIDLHRNYKTDYITGFTLVWGVEEYIPRSMKSDSEYFSPLRHPFPTQPPIWVMVGGAEVLHDSIVGFVENMRNIKDNRVELYQVPHAPHDVFWMGNLLGWAMEASSASRAANDFLKNE
jgi:acetyl esterase/lipase